MSNLFNSIEWLWDAMTKTTSHIAFTIAFGLIIILYVLIINEENASNLWRFFISCVILILVGCLEVYAQVVFQDDPTWFLSSFGNFVFGMIILFVAFLMMIGQYHMTRGILEGLSYLGDYNNKYDNGFKSIIVASVAAIIASFFGQQYAYIVGGIFLLFQFYIVGHTIYTAIANNGSVLCALFSIIIYMCSAVGLVFLFVHFMLPAIFALIIIAIGNGKNRCYNCRSYSNGYCYYRKKYVSGGSEACPKYE